MLGCAALRAVHLHSNAPKGQRYERCRTLPLAIRPHGHVPLPVRSAHARIVRSARHHGEHLRHHRPHHLARYDALLGHPVRHQLRPRRCHRPDHGIRVRHELGLLRPLCRRHLWCTAGDRRADGVLPRSHLHRYVLLRVEQAEPRAAPRRHGTDGAGHQPVRAMDPDRQRVDAVSGRCALQHRHHAHGDHRLLGRGVQPRGAGEVRAHSVGRLRHRLDVRAVGQRVLPAARPLPWAGDPLADRRRQLRPGLGAVGRRARRRERLHGRPEPEDEGRRDRGDVADPARPGILHRGRHSRHADPRNRRRNPRSLGAGPDRHPLDQWSGGRHRQPCLRSRAAHQKRHDRLRCHADAAPASHRRHRAHGL